jgi:hypothetical protein
LRRFLAIEVNRLQAYDSHCNLVLGEVEETIYIIEEDEDEQEIVKVCALTVYRGVMVLISAIRHSRSSLKCSLFEVRNIPCIATFGF